MYISKIALKNWRSYADATFEFKKPTAKKPLVLIGAMNGHGKTSLLVSLYLGLFGRFGLRYCEGAASFDEKNASFYRKSIQNFRRNTATADEPTSIELVFSPTLNPGDRDEEEIRLVRRWYFTSLNQPKQGEAFEEVILFIGGKPCRMPIEVDGSFDRLEKYLFPAHVMPAFFFDGEQAQTLINNAGEQGIKKAVEVMYGTKVIEELNERIMGYINTSRQKLGGVKQTSEKERELDQKKLLRIEINARIADQQKQYGDLESQKESLEKERRNIQETLAKLGGAIAQNAKKIHEDVIHAERDQESAVRELAECAESLGVCLAVSRLAMPILNRMESEDQRERWERLREGAIDRTDHVISVAMPEPASQDQLLGNLSGEVREKVKQRFRIALEQIYNPPPINCATEYLLGHVKGELRQKSLIALNRLRRISSTDIRQKAQELKHTRDAYQDAVARSNRLKDLPKEIEEMTEQLNTINSQMQEAFRQISIIDHEIKKLKGDYHSLNAEIGRLQEEVAKMEPEQKRIAVAERVGRVLEELTDKLRPITISRLEESVTKHFLSIADKKYRGGQIVFPKDGEPNFRMGDGTEQLISTMSGFERRSFGIAFSLALAEITQRRIPLIIDTPLGNADTQYRPRLLKAVTNVDLDQVIILTHDAEVNGPLLDVIKNQTCQRFLVKYDEVNKESVVYPNQYFDEGESE